ncbi:MAG: DNA-directed DNA polymerase II small subunit [Candidatus Diapherotrites archaeon]|nr:DNA-directed DNA polymerase II small subunit [Candidatus Diapherotrites archaeon]
MMLETGTNINKIVDFARDKKLIMDKDALAVLSVRPDWRSILEEIANDGFFLITKEEIEKRLLRTKISLLEESFELAETSKKTEEREGVRNFRILKEYDVTDKSYTQGSVEDFVKLFRDKFHTLKTILEQRHTLRAKPIKRLKYTKEQEEIELIGMVYRKWETKAGHTALELEDLEDRCIVVIPKNDRKLEVEKNRIMLDDVLGIRGVKVSKDMVIAKEILWPDLPQRNMKLINKEVYVASISDMHVGSKLFLERAFQKFLAWINGNAGSPEEKKFVKKIKYLFVTGDNVDGIGIYPKQHSELNIKSIKEQYEVFSNYILEIPERIEVFIIPGQHDAVRWADPQPAIPKKLVPKLYEAENVHLLGSPSWVEIEGLKVLLYHGSCLHDVFSNISGLSYEKPQYAIIELLRRRDLMPAYGMKHPYVPERRDYMVIREVPDLVFVGDLHHVGYATYRGTTIINNSTWQDRTDYQIKQGHVPTPGIAIVLSLKDRKIYEKHFLVS